MCPERVISSYFLLNTSRAVDEDQVQRKRNAYGK